MLKVEEGSEGGERGKRRVADALGRRDCRRGKTEKRNRKRRK